MDELSRARIRKSVHDKVSRYIFNKDSMTGWPKGVWFIKALAFNPEKPEHIDLLVRQINFNRSAAKYLKTTTYGVLYNQVLRITGPNGKTIDCIRAGWLRDPSNGSIRLITILPPKK
jgi:hypothetical protein